MTVKLSSNTIPIHSIDSVRPRKKMYREYLSKKLVISTSSKFYILDIDQIAYLQSRSNYCEVKFMDGTSILTSRTLKYMTDKLKEHPFIRVHASYLINFTQITSVEKNGICKAVLRNGEQIPISRSYWNQLTEELMDRV